MLHNLLRNVAVLGEPVVRKWTGAAVLTKNRESREFE